MQRKIPFEMSREMFSADSAQIFVCGSSRDWNVKKKEFGSVTTQSPMNEDHCLSKNLENQLQTASTWSDEDALTSEALSTSSTVAFTYVSLSYMHWLTVTGALNAAVCVCELVSSCQLVSWRHRKSSHTRPKFRKRLKRCYSHPSVVSKSSLLLLSYKF